MKKIIHIDMDAFYASVEQLDNPSLKGIPIAVGGSRERGVVAAASYEAREFGVHSALASSIAVRRCPELVFVKPRFERYKEVSNVIMRIFKDYTDLVEPLSLDEAYLDVSYNKKGFKSAIKIAMLIREQIAEEVGLTASAGVSFNKFLAKTASDLNKPNGLSVILPEDAIEFLERLPIEKFHGIGKVTASKMHEMGIHLGKDLMKLGRTELIKRFGKAGKHYHDIITAQDRREVKPDRIRKSIGAESTFSNDLIDSDAFVKALEMIHDTVMQRLLKSGRMGRTVTLKIKYFDFLQNTRSHTFEKYTSNSNQIWQTVLKLLNEPEEPNRAVRLFGITISNLDIRGEIERGQLTLGF